MRIVHCFWISEFWPWKNRNTDKKTLNLSTEQQQQQSKLLCVYCRTTFKLDWWSFGMPTIAFDIGMHLFNKIHCSFRFGNHNTHTRSLSLSHKSLKIVLIIHIIELEWMNLLARITVTTTATKAPKNDQFHCTHAPLVLWNATKTSHLSHEVHRHTRTINVIKISSE